MGDRSSDAVPVNVTDTRRCPRPEFLQARGDRDVRWSPVLPVPHSNGHACAGMVSSQMYATASTATTPSGKAVVSHSTEYGAVEVGAEASASGEERDDADLYIVLSRRNHALSSADDHSGARLNQ